MAIVTRVNGDAKGVVNVDFDSMVATGLTKRPTAFKITATADLDTANTVVDGVVTVAADERRAGGAVEAILRVISQRATIVMYQVDGDQLSVLVEAHGWGNPAATPAVTADADLTAALVAIPERSAVTVAPTSPAFVFAGTTVSSAAGFKLA